MNNLNVIDETNYIYLLNEDNALIFKGSVNKKINAIRLCLFSKSDFASHNVDYEIDTQETLLFHQKSRDLILKKNYFSNLGNYPNDSYVLKEQKLIEHYEPTELQYNSSGKCSIKLNLNTQPDLLTDNYLGKCFQLISLGQNDVPNGKSFPFVIFNNGLKFITSESEWKQNFKHDDSKTLPFSFYKNMESTHACINFTISIPNEIIPCELQAFLLNENGSLIKDQSILFIKSDLNANDTVAVVSFKITECSRFHGKTSFCVLVEALNTAPTVSNLFYIKSKHPSTFNNALDKKKRGRPSLKKSKLDSENDDEDEDEDGKELVDYNSENDTNHFALSQSENKLFTHFESAFRDLEYAYKEMESAFKKFKKKKESLTKSNKN